MSLTMLPPTPRDFNIHRLSLILNFSTWRIAEKHHISQTRVRQIIQRVSQWLAATVPVKTDLEQEQEVRLAQHLAAEQMRHQIETLQNYWEGSGDPKYLRHQTRVIAALARLGVVPGAIEAIAADATLGPYDPTQPQPPWSEDDPWPNSSSSSSSTPHSALHNPHSSSPPPGDFSAPANSAPAAEPPTADANPATPSSPTTSALPSNLVQDTIDGLNHMETNLLTRIANTPPADEEKLDRLRQSLAEIRACKAKYESKANYQVRVAPSIVGAAVHAESESMNDLPQLAAQK